MPSNATWFYRIPRLRDPDGNQFWGRQALASHRLDGGHRVIDVLGPDSDNITFSGTFSGRGALVRANAVDSLRRRGINTVLLWDNISYDVVVNAFSANFMNRMWIPYKCTCCVMSGSVSSSGESSLYGRDNSFLSTSMLSTVGALIQTLPELTGLSANVEMLDGSQSSSATVSQAQSSVMAGVAAAEQELITTLDIACTSAGTAISTLANLEAATQSLSMLIAAQSYLGGASYGMVVS